METGEERMKLDQSHLLGGKSSPQKNIKLASRSINLTATQHFT